MKKIDSFALGTEYECFSNFHRMVVPCNVRRERFFYTEVAYQALKAKDMPTFRKIMETNNPKLAKQMGRKVKLNVKNWDAMKLGIMFMLLEMKFWSNPGMAEILKSTGSAMLVEGNHWHDNYWGDCTCGNEDGEHPECLDPGKNMLGKLLMRLRTELQTYFPSA